MTHSKTGTLYGVSLGPGDPGLITRHAWHKLEGDGHWTYPVRKKNGDSYALDIALRAGFKLPESHTPLLFPMTHDSEILARYWLEAAQTVLAHLQNGEDVLFLVEGDASTYSTFGHLQRSVRGLQADVAVEVIAGVSSFHAAAARCGEPLADVDDTIAIIPAGYGISLIENRLNDFDTLILLKVKPLLDDIIDLLRRRNLLSQSRFIEKAGTPEERLVLDIASLQGQKVNYLSLLIIKNPGRQRTEMQRGCRKKRMKNMTEVRVAIIAITKHGASIASRLAAHIPEAEIVVSEKQSEHLGDFPNKRLIYQGALSAQIGDFFARYDQLIFLVSLGAVIRLIAPYLKSKDEDPGVLVIDDAAAFVIPVLSGHVGGANAYSEKVAAFLEAIPVITTASDVGKTIPVDILGRELGWQIEAPKINITRVSADVVNQLPIAFVQEAGSGAWWTRNTPLPANIKLFQRFEEVDTTLFASILWVTRRAIEPAIWEQLTERLVVYRPPGENM